MRRIPLALSLVATACLALTACDPGPGDSGGDAKQSASPTHSQPSPTQSATGAPAGDDTGPAAVGLGEPSRTVGAKTVGILEITPTTVVYAEQGAGVSPQNGVFAVVALSEKSMSANPADEEPAPGGGWQWIGPDGTPVAAGNGNAGKVTLDGYLPSGAIEPGGTATRARVFDLTPEQAKGGKLVYTDGTQAPHGWKLPAEDTGPQVADIKGKLGL